MSQAANAANGEGAQCAQRRRNGLGPISASASAHVAVAQPTSARITSVMIVKPAAPPRALSPRCCFIIGGVLAVRGNALACAPLRRRDHCHDAGHPRRAVITEITPTRCSRTSVHAPRPPLAVVPQVVSALGIVSATVVYATIDAQLQQGLRDHYVLDSPSAGAYAEWADQDTPGAPVIYTDFYVYHVENPWDMVHNGAKPNLTQVGPLAYYYKQKKYDVSWDAEESGDIVTYWQWQYYVPVDDATAALARTNVTSIYVPLLGILANPRGATGLGCGTGAVRRAGPGGLACGPLAPRVRTRARARCVQRTLHCTCQLHATSAGSWACIPIPWTFSRTGASTTSSSGGRTSCWPYCARSC